MGGVDKLNWLVNKFRTKIRGKKWYFPIFTHLLDVTIVNDHVLYCMSHTPVPLLVFRRMIVKAYLQISSLSDPKNAGRPSKQLLTKRVPKDIRTDSVGHYLQRTENGKQRKCAICKTNVRKECGKCNEVSM